MPNWITNNVRIIADETLLAKIREEVKGTPYSNGEDKEFDFNQIAPIPTELVGTTSPCRIITQEEYDIQEERITKGELTESEVRFGVSRGITKEMHDDFIERFGYADWYGWQISNWGTKWNASDVYWSDDNESVSFNTAWSTPFNLFLKLSEKYPEARIEVEYADEDFGYNVGTYTLVGGVEIEENVPEGGTREAYEMALNIQGGEDYYLGDDFCDVDEDEELSKFTNSMIEIAYDRDYMPTEDCGYARNVLERFKEIALANENFELVATIQKELEKVEK
jgi:hypothetical protein